jgi:hypothetical protein
MRGDHIISLRDARIKIAAGARSLPERLLSMSKKPGLTIIPVRLTVFYSPAVLLAG